MIKLIRLEWKKNYISKYIRNAIITAAVLCLFMFAQNFLGIARDPDSGVPDTAPGYNSTAMPIELFCGSVFLVFTGVMLSSFIVSSYKNKTMNLMFCYPIKRQKVILAQMLAVWIFNIIALVLTKLCVYGLTMIASQFMTSDFPIDFNMASPDFYLKLILKAVVTVSVSFNALFVGLRLKSSKATIIVSFLLVFLLQGRIGDLSLSNNGTFPIILMAVSLLCVILSLLDVERKDLM